MKHDFKVTLFLIGLFLAAQAVGLFLLNQSISTIDTDAGGTIKVNYSEPLTGRPDLQNESSFTYVLAMILFGTILLLMLIKFRMFKVYGKPGFSLPSGAHLRSHSQLSCQIYLR